MGDVTDTEAAWLAGLLEGEGYLGCRNDGTHSHTVRLNLTDRDVIERVVAVTGLGRVWERQPTGSMRRGSWQWAVYVREDADELMARIRPYMGERRRAAIDEALSCSLTKRCTNAGWAA
jgi:hypothetical protein